MFPHLCAHCPYPSLSHLLPPASPSSILLPFAPCLLPPFPQIPCVSGLFYPGKAAPHHSPALWDPALGSGAEVMAQGCDLALELPGSIPECVPGMPHAQHLLQPLTSPVAALVIRQHPVGRDVMCWVPILSLEQGTGGDGNEPVQGCDGCSGQQQETPMVPWRLAGLCCCHIPHYWRLPGCPCAPSIPVAHGWSSESRARAAHGCLEVNAQRCQRGAWDVMGDAHVEQLA